MELLDCLSDEDKETIVEFITSYSGCQPNSIETILHSWNKNKRTMFKALGKQLRVKIPVHLQIDEQLYYRQLQEIYFPPSILKKNTDNNHLFINEFINFFYDYYTKVKTDASSISSLENLFYYSSIEKGKTLYENSFYRYETNTNLTIPKGTKIIKAIQRVLKFYDFPHMDSFDKWRNDISNLTTAKSIKTNMVFSIHPIDFLTMSDNNCSWQSCMSWMQKGSYSTGVIEMLNSNMAIICYLESSKDFHFNYHKIPNKSWRCLFYLHKNILLSGKQYPYYNEQIVNCALDYLQKLLQKNLQWSYQYKNQLYQDLKHYHDNWYVREDLFLDQLRLSKNTLGKDRHSILLYTYGMYNDLIEDHDTKYWCCRNYVDRTIKISVSGVATCMQCGNPIDTKEELDNLLDSELHSHGSIKYCRTCEDEKWCVCCNTVNNNQKYFIEVKHYNGHLWKQLVCEKCINEYFYHQKEKYFIHKDNLSTFRGDRENLISTKEVKNLEEYIVSDTI